MHLRLKHALSAETPFGGEQTNETIQSIYERLLDVETATAADRVMDSRDFPSQQVEIEPWDIQSSLEKIITDRLDYLHHEAFYVVDTDFEVTAYRTHWFGLEYDCRAVEDAPTVGNGALRTVRWYDGEPVGDGFAQGEFRALKAIAGDMIDRGVFTHSDALEYMTDQLDRWVGDGQELLVRKASVPE